MIYDFLAAKSVRDEAAINRMMPTTVFHRIVSCRISMARIGAITGLIKKVMEPVVASEYLIPIK